MASRRERRVEQICYTPPRRNPTYGAPPVEHKTEETHLRIKVILLEQDIVRAQKDLDRVRAERNIAIAEKDIAERECKY
jgi:hypothetical protein